MTGRTLLAALTVLLLSTAALALSPTSDVSLVQGTDADRVFHITDGVVIDNATDTQPSEVTIAPDAILEFYNPTSDPLNISVPNYLQKHKVRPGERIQVTFSKPNTSFTVWGEQYHNNTGWDARMIVTTKPEEKDDSEGEGGSDYPAHTNITVTDFNTLNATCQSGKQDRLQQESVTTKDGMVELTFTGWMQAPDPCHKAVYDTGVEEGRYVLYLDPHKTGNDTCTQCVGRVKYRATVQFSPDYPLLVRHEGQRIGQFDPDYNPGNGGGSDQGELVKKLKELLKTLRELLSQLMG
jgi:hypothetical protein